MLKPGDELDRYVIDAFVGEGGMGTVYQATDRKLRRRVALKILRREGAGSESDSQGAARLLHEARAAAALDHANAVSIFDVGEIDGSPYIAMEFIAGMTLRECVGRMPVPFGERVRWLVDVARALAAAHARGLIHRDIKPDNVMLREDGAIKVLDFGIARTTHLADTAAMAETVPAPITREGTLLGTPMYMSPEQLRGEVLDGRSDQFSWGVVAYEVLAGRLPWKGAANGYGLVASILADTADPMSSSEIDVPAAVEAVVMRTLAKSREDRFASMDDVVAALDPLASRPMVLTPRGARISSIPRPMPSASPAAETMTEVARSLPPKTLPSMPAAPQQNLARGIVIALSAVGVVVLVVFLALRLRAPDDASSTDAAPAVDHAAPAIVPTAITAVPPPETAVPAAASAYLAGLQSVRDASLMNAVTSFDRAATLDPSMAAAHMRAYLYGSGLSEFAPHQHLQHARELRSKLSERDQAVLSLIDRDTGAADAGLGDASAALLARFPGDAELWFITADFADSKEGARARYERALALDPEFAATLWQTALMQDRIGDEAGSAESIARCLSISPLAVSCFRVRTFLEEDRGECDAMYRDAKTVIEIEHGYRASEMLARAMFARDMPPEAVRDALTQKWALMPEFGRHTAQLIDEARLAMATGDFATAENRLVELLTLAGEHPEARRADLANLYVEEGDPARGARVADAYLKREGALRDDMGEAHDRLLSIATRGGLRPGEQDAERKAARGRLTNGTLHEQWPYWVFAYADASETKEEARAAVAVMPRPIGTLGPLSNEQLGLGAAGKALFLAGDLDEALPQLTYAVKSCVALQAPYEHTRAAFFLGQALDAKGDHAGACAAYKVVLARWGTAKPRSVTAEAAKARVRALSCPK